VIDLDALYMTELTSSPELAIAGFSLKTKSAIFAKLNTSPRPPRSVPNTAFLVYDLSRYVTANVVETNVQRGADGFSVFFVEEGKTGGVRVLGKRYSDRVEVGRFTLGAAPATK
jgi:hypothetical protein